jgi:hypothetical protein
VLPAIAILPLPIFAGVSFAVLHLVAPGHLSASVAVNPALAPIQNRPPPCA